MYKDVWGKRLNDEPQLSQRSSKLQPVILRNITINIPHEGFKLLGQSPEVLTDGFFLEDKKYGPFRVIFSLGLFSSTDLWPY